MANLPSQSALAALATIASTCNGGTLVWYSGTMPTTPETALSGNTALATFTFSATAFATGTFSGGFAQQAASFAASTVTPSANGTATFARALKSDGTSPAGDFTIGTSGTDIVVASPAVQTAVQLTLSSFVIKLPGV